jgi:hypothetical protein
MVHLAGRFFGSLRPGGPSRSEVGTVRTELSPAEFGIWSGMSGPDRRHSVGVAARVRGILGPEADRSVVAAALLHDSGKVDSRLHTPGRVVATVMAGLVKHDEITIRRWAAGRGYQHRLGLYLLHPERGAEHLECAGSDPLTVAWTREHHLPPADCTLDKRLADALRDADND